MEEKARLFFYLRFTEKALRTSKLAKLTEKNMISLFLKSTKKATRLIFHMPHVP